MFRYIYEGPVMEFDQLVDPDFKATTMAVSEKKARANLTYQWKKHHGRMRNAKITLPGKVEAVY